MSEAQAVVRRHLYENPPRFDVDFYDLGVGEVDALRVSLYTFARNERKAFNNGDAYGENISNIGLLAEGLADKLGSAMTPIFNN
jgi:hypothetical protein